MQSVIFAILGLLIGAALAGAGIYYRIKEKHDRDSAKIYGIFTLIGAVMVVGAGIKIIVAGF